MASVLKYGNFGLKFLTGTGFVRLSDIATPVQYPYITFEFSASGFTPTLNLINSVYRDHARWVQVTGSIWKLEILGYSYSQVQMGIGISVMFASPDGSTGYLVPANLGGGTCTIIDSGNWDTPLNGSYCESFDRTFSNCTGLTGFTTIYNSHAVNVGGMFQGCVNVQYGAMVQYNYFSTYALNITNHSSTFSNCGSGNISGQAELAQIPVGWGGTQVPASTLMTSSVKSYTGSNKSAWEITGNAPDWTNITGMYLFTEVSVSQYAGVSMNRSRIPNGLNGFGTTQGTYALYFYPAFVQTLKLPGQSDNWIYWIATTDIPNGSLTVSQGNTDMPGTLDYSTYGPITRVYGTYQSWRTVYFVFLVTNYPITNYDPSTTQTQYIRMAFLYNSNFKTDGGFRYFY